MSAEGTGSGRKKRRPELPGRIVAAAVELFDARGYRGTSMEEIASAIGLTAGALYQHFRDKQAILDAVLDEASDRQCRTLEATEADAGRRLVGFVERLAYLAATESALMSVARHDRSMAGSGAEGRVRDAEEAVLIQWQKALRECRPDLSPAEAHLTVEAVLGAAYSPTHTVSPLPAERRAALVSDGIVAALVGDGQRRRAGRAGVEAGPGAASDPGIGPPEPTGEGEEGVQARR